MMNTTTSPTSQSFTPPRRGLSAAKPRIELALRQLLTVIAVLFPIALAACSTPPRSTNETVAPDIDLPNDQSHTLKIVSFNIRYPNPGDGLDRWDRRRHRVLQTVERLVPDVLGVQEAFDFQAAFLRDGLTGYDMIGVGRDDGAAQGEMTAILYRTDRLDLIDHGHLWLSETPDLPGSVGWDAALTRMATWLVLHDRLSHKTWLIINTHFDHRGVAARTESAKLLARFVQEKRAALGDGCAAVLMGDFNAAVDSAPYRALCDPADEQSLNDTYRAARLRITPADGEGTFNDFRSQTDGARIDWILTTPNIIPLEAGIDRIQVDDRNPSDHDPVWAVLQYE